jgi:hypothetical protein
MKTSAVAGKGFFGKIYRENCSEPAGTHMLMT